MNTDLLNGLAGVAALINSLLLWPVIRSLKKMDSALTAITSDHAVRITTLEAVPKSKRRPKRA